MPEHQWELLPPRSASPCLPRYGVGRWLSSLSVRSDLCGWVSERCFHRPSGLTVLSTRPNSTISVRMRRAKAPVRSVRTTLTPYPSGVASPSGRHGPSWQAKAMTDGVWWFFLFWAPAYFSDQFGFASYTPMGAGIDFCPLLHRHCNLDIRGYLPRLFVEKRGMNPYAGRMRAMLIFAFIPITALFAQPLGMVSPWWPAVIIGLAGAAHQALERQSVFNNRRHVSHLHRRNDCRYRHYGWWCEFLYHQSGLRHTV